MIFLYDNLTATVIGATVLLVILVSMQRLTEVQIERTATYTVKKQANEFATWMEEDLLKMRMHVPEDVHPVPFTDPTYDSEGLLTTDFIFRQDSTDYAVDPPEQREIHVRYRTEEVGQRTIGGEVVPVYQLTRYTCDSTSGNCNPNNDAHWSQDGASSDLLSYFRVDLLDRNAQPIANPATTEASSPGTVRNSRIRFAMVTPFETDRQTLREVYYGATLILEL